MLTTITREMVLLYIANRLSISERRLLESSFNEDPQVQLWFVELGSLPDSVLEAETSDPSVQRRLATSNPWDRDLYEFADSCETNAAELFTDFDFQTVCVPLSKWYTKMYFEEKVAGASTDVSGSITSKPDTYIFQRGRFVSLDCPYCEIPHGLAWLYLKEQNQVVTSYLPHLQTNDLTKSWWFNEVVEEVLSGRSPVGKQIEVCGVPMTSATRGSFDNPRVHEFVRQLPAKSRQRQLAANFLGLEL
jgi:hypothetical protein